MAVLRPLLGVYDVVIKGKVKCAQIGLAKTSTLTNLFLFYCVPSRAFP